MMLFAKEWVLTATTRTSKDAHMLIFAIAILSLPSFKKISEKTNAPNTDVGMYLSQRSTNGDILTFAKTNGGKTRGRYDTIHIPIVQYKISREFIFSCTSFLLRSLLWRRIKSQQQYAAYGLIH